MKFTSQRIVISGGHLSSCCRPDTEAWDAPPRKKNQSLVCSPKCFHNFRFLKFNRVKKQLLLKFSEQECIILVKWTALVAASVGVYGTFIVVYSWKSWQKVSFSALTACQGQLFSKTLEIGLKIMEKLILLQSGRIMQYYV